MTIDMTGIVLKMYSHASREEGMCAMEAAAYVAGEEHSDRPRCVCPIISTFIRNWNDGIADDETRTSILSPLLPKVINTRSTAEVERARSYMALDWLVRESASAWLDTAGLSEHAAALRALSAIVDAETARACADTCRVAMSAAREFCNGDDCDDYSAFYSSASNAAGGAAFECARLAGYCHIENVVARTIGRIYATNSRKADTTVKCLQTSAHHLVERMAAITAT